MSPRLSPEKYMKNGLRDKPMHIAAISYYYHPIVNGVIATIDDWKHVAQTHGATYTVVTAHLTGEKPEPDVVRFPSLSILRRVGVTVPWFPEQMVERELRERRIDVIHVHHPFFLGSLALRMGKRLGVPVVFTYHTRYSEYAKSYLPFIPGTIIDRVVERSVTSFVNQCQAVTVALPTLKQELRIQGVKTPIFVVPIGIDTARFAQGNGQKIRKTLHISKDDPVILYVGRIAQEKNIFVLFDAVRAVLARYPRAHMCWVGTGPEAGVLAHRIQAENLIRRMHMVTPGSYQDMPDFYGAGDIFVSASITETFGRVFVEAMAAGLPPVAARTPTIGDVIENDHSGLIVPNNPEDFAHALTRLLADRALAKQLGSEAALRAKTQFDVSVSWQALAGVYSAVRAPRTG